MARERYPGERRGLSLFLEDLLPEALQACGHHAILPHAIRRALRTGDLDHLRHARTIFNHLPREQRRRLSAACIAGGGSARPPEHEGCRTGAGAVEQDRCRPVAERGWRERGPATARDGAPAQAPKSSS
jgi:hypothetical protein